jgi:hypothetical protein
MIVLLPFLAIAAAAQAPPSNWNSVKMLAPGTQVRVAGTSTPGTSKPMVGTLESVTDDDLVLMQGTGPRSFPRAKIVSVSVQKERHRVRNALIGLGMGTAAGIAIGGGLGAAQAQNCQTTFLCGLAVPVDAAGGGAIGLVAGTLTGLFWPPGWQKVYAP